MKDEKPMLPSLLVLDTAFQGGVQGPECSFPNVVLQL